uniref:Uncharacterized protein n=1 Tax=Cynoglossus semilaevis TaxID=244447 RepID=A0A3P8W2A0_CYNSE
MSLGWLELLTVCVCAKQKSFKPIVTECPPDELCFRADGRFGNHSALSARGCMAKKDCSQVHKLRFKGSVYTMSYACCEGPYLRVRGSWSDGLVSREQPTTEQSVSITVTLFSRHC